MEETHWRNLHFSTGHSFFFFVIFSLAFLTYTPIKDTDRLTDSHKKLKILPYKESFLLYLLEGIALTWSFRTFSSSTYSRSPRSVATYVYQNTLDKHSFDRCNNLKYMYIGIYENCFCLKYWKQSLLSVSLARFFFFFFF